MTEDHSESIFDFASKRPARPIKKKIDPAATLHPPTQTVPAISASLSEPRQDVNQVMEEIAQKREALNRQLEETYKLSGYTRDTVKDYLTNPNNFPDTTWKIVQEQREELSKKVTNLRLKSGSKESREIKKSRDDKKRKGKSLGARRNWLSM